MRYMKGSVTVFVLIMLGLVIGMFLFGYVPMVVQFIGVDVLQGETGATIQEITTDQIFNNIKDTLFSSFGLITLSTAIGFGLLTGLAGVGYASQSILSILLPALLLFAFSNIFFFPIVSYVDAEGMPYPLNFIMLIIYNVLLMLTVLTFITGRD